MEDKHIRVAFLGLGVMGYPMAGHLAGAGYAVTVYNRSPEKSERWLEEYKGAGTGGHESAVTPAQAAKEADIIFACVGADCDVIEVATGPHGLFKTAKADAVFIDHTTVSPKTARLLHSEAECAGCTFIDAPVSGGQAGAEKGALTIMCGGSRDVYDRVLPVMQCYARHCRLLGDVGSGQLAKIVNQICIAGVLQGLSEGLNFAEAAGLDIEGLISVISRGAAGSWQMENRALTMAAGKFDFGFAVDWMRKDLDIAVNTAGELGADLPMIRQVDGYYKNIQAKGGGRFDTSSLILNLKKTG